MGAGAASRGRLPADARRSPASEALPGYSARPVSDLGDDAAYSPFFGMAAPPLSEFRGAAFAVLSGLRAAASADSIRTCTPQTCLIGHPAPCWISIRKTGFLQRILRRSTPYGSCVGCLIPGNTALARFLDIHGEGLVLGTACASALQAIGEASGACGTAFRKPSFAQAGIPPFPRQDARVCQSPRAQPEPRAIGSVPPA